MALGPTNCKVPKQGDRFVRDYLGIEIVTCKVVILVARADIVMRECKIKQEKEKEKIRNKTRTCVHPSCGRQPI